jgi:hypothetical protein
MKIKIIAGAIVHAISIICPSSMNQFVYLLKINVVIIYDTTMRIIKIIISAWSWKKINCSIIGDALSCKFMLAHVVIILIKV